MTLTFDPKKGFPVSQGRAEREAWRWCTSLEWVFRRPVGWLYVTERGRSGLWHAHVLVIGVGEARWDLPQAWWERRNGRADIQPVFDGSGAVLYVTKNAGERGDVTLSDTLRRYKDRAGQAIVVKLCLGDGSGAGEGTMKATTKNAVQRVAQSLDAVEQRVRQLRELAEEVTDRFLRLALALHREHEAELWTKARTSEGLPYPSEEHFLEEAVDVKRRTAYQLIAIGRVLSKIGLETDNWKALVEVGLYKMDILVPILEREPTAPTLQKWAVIARTHTRETLREQVQEALGRPARRVSEPGARFEQMVKRTMPDDETRTLARDFFRVGKKYLRTRNAVEVMIAAMQQCLGTWEHKTP